MIPGVEEFKNGDVSGGLRSITIELTPLNWSNLAGAGLGAFYDECYRELYEDDETNPLNSFPPGPASNEDPEEVLKKRQEKWGRHF